MAQTITFHQKLKLTFPEGFREMSQAERGNLTMIAEGPGSCLTDPERHIIVSVGWRPLGRWTSLILSAKDAAKNMAGSIRNAMAPYGCRVTRASGKRIDGEGAEGVCFDYTVQEIGMYGESYVVKRDRVFYYLHVYVREEAKGESLNLWEEILSTAKWI